MVVTDRVALRPVRLGVEIAAMRCTAHGANTSSSGRAACLDRGRSDAHALGRRSAAIVASWAAAEARWRLLRAKYLLYR